MQQLNLFDAFQRNRVWTAPVYFDEFKAIIVVHFPISKIIKTLFGKKAAALYMAKAINFSLMGSLQLTNIQAVCML